jgi:RNA polymerase sigma-70 factor (ECF subfamily)
MMPIRQITTLPDDLQALLPALNRRARRLTHCAEDAADLAQEAALRLWQHHQSGTDIDCPEAYAMTILRNLSRSHWRTSRNHDPLEENTAMTAPEAPRVIACAELSAAITRLPAPQAELLHYVENGETSPARLAELTGHPVNTVMSRLARARASLRAEMGMSKTCSVTSLFDETPMV